MTILNFLISCSIDKKLLLRIEESENLCNPPILVRISDPSDYLLGNEAKRDELLIIDNYNLRKQL